MNLVAGGGVALTALLVFSAGVLFAVAWNEGWGVVKNTPVTFYRCDGMGHDCCKNGPHGLGAHPRFAYLSDGRGFETRQKDSMRRHLLRSRRCRELQARRRVPQGGGMEALLMRRERRASGDRGGGDVYQQ